MLSDLAERASLCVAPLEIPPSQLEDAANGSCNSSQQHVNLYLQSHMTSPATPKGSQEDLSPEAAVDPPLFHNFLRAFFPFSPSCAMTESSVTLPLDEGDVVLVHSVHTNGWADGTLLATGARGWLPTNHCNAYEPDDMRSLLNALLNFWDLLQSTSMDDNEIFRNQEFMKGIIAGVRSLLERTNCLNRESPSVRRALSTPEDVNDLDEMILKAFKIVIKAVRFLDILDEDTKSRASAAVTVVATVAEESGSGAPASELGGLRLQTLLPRPGASA
ncbi:variant SH3 domain-containing protein [Hirsutella rhossiliensis]